MWTVKTGTRRLLPDDLLVVFAAADHCSPESHAEVVNAKLFRIGGIHSEKAKYKCTSPPNGSFFFFLSRATVLCSTDPTPKKELPLRTRRCVDSVHYKE